MIFFTANFCLVGNGIEKEFFYSSDLIFFPFSETEGKLLLIPFVMSVTTITVFLYSLTKTIDSVFLTNNYVLTRINTKRASLFYIFIILKEIVLLFFDKVFADILVSNTNNLMVRFNPDYIFKYISLLLTIILWGEMIYCLKLFHLKTNNVFFLILSMCILTQSLVIKVPILGILTMISTDEKAFILLKSLFIVTLWVIILIKSSKYECIGENKYD